MPRVLGGWAFSCGRDAHVKVLTSPRARLHHRRVPQGLQGLHTLVLCIKPTALPPRPQTYMV